VVPLRFEYAPAGGPTGRPSYTFFDATQIDAFVRISEHPHTAWMFPHPRARHEQETLRWIFPHLNPGDLEVTESLGKLMPRAIVRSGNHWELGDER